MAIKSLEPGPRVLISEVKLKQRVRELAAQITEELRGREVVAVCILRGSFIFFADLIRYLDMPLTCEFMGLSSYGSGTNSTGEVKVTLDLMEPIQGKNVLIIEDIVDSGLTMEYLLSNLKTRKPASIRTAALLVKPENLETDVEVDYCGFKIGNEFVVGYGLDYAGKHRQLPYIGILDKEN